MAFFGIRLDLRNPAFAGIDGWLPAEPAADGGGDSGADAEAAVTTLGKGKASAKSPRFALRTVAWGPKEMLGLTRCGSEGVRVERGMALVVAAAGALMSATGVVGATGMLTGSDRAADLLSAPVTDMASVGSPLRTSTPLEPITVTERRDIFDMVVVPSQPEQPPAPAPVAPTNTLLHGDGAGAEEAAPAPVSTTTTSPPAVTPRPAPTTTTTPTTTPTTTTTKPSRRQMPRGCIDGELEDDGRWNCQSPESDD